MSMSAWMVQPPTQDTMSNASPREGGLSERFGIPTREMNPLDFNREISKILNTKQRAYKMNKEIFEEVQRNLPIYSELTKQKVLLTQRKLMNQTTQNQHKQDMNMSQFFAENQSHRTPNHEMRPTQIQYDRNLRSDMNTHSNSALCSPVQIPRTQVTPTQMMCTLTSDNFGKSDQNEQPNSQPTMDSRNQMNCPGPVTQRMLLQPRGSIIDSQNLDIKTRSNSINQGAASTRIGSPLDTTQISKIAQVNKKRPPGTAAGNRARRNFCLSQEDRQKDFQQERLSLVTQNSVVEPSYLLKEQFKKAYENHERWKQKKLTHLTELDVELELNFDMFETSDGFSKMTDPSLQKTEVDREKLSNWSLRYFIDQLDKRDLDFPDPQLTEAFLEATQIMRGCLAQFKGDKQMTQTMAVVWKSIITSTDLGLRNSNTQLKNAEEIVWKHAQKKYSGQINGLNDRIMTLERQKIDVNAEVKRLASLVANNSDEHTGLQTKIYELYQEFENLRDPRGVADFKQNLQKIINLFPEYESLKNIQYKTLERSIKLMSKNVKEPDMMEFAGDGTRRKKKAYVQPDIAAWADSGKSAVYNNAFGFRPVRCGHQYDLTDVTSQTMQLAQIVNSVSDVQVGHIFKEIIGDKLTADEIQKLKIMLTEQITPMIDAQVRSQMTDSFNEVLRNQKKKILASINCKRCGHKVVDVDGRGGEKYMDTDSEVEKMMKAMRNGVDIVKKKQHKKKRTRERDGSDSDYEWVVDKKTGKKIRGKKLDMSDLYEIDPNTGQPKIDKLTGGPMRNRKRPHRKEHYSTGESSYHSADLYEQDPVTGAFRTDPKTGERIKKQHSQMFEKDPKTGKAKIDPETGRHIRRYDSDVYLIDSDTGRPAVDPDTGKKILKKQVNQDEYEIDPATGKPKLDPETGRPIRKKGARKRMNADGKMESDSGTDYEIDAFTGKPLLDPKTGWPVPKTEKPNRKTFAEDDYNIDMKTGKPKMDPKSGRPLKKKGVRKNGRYREDSEETEYELDPLTGKPKIDPKTGWPIPKYKLDPKTGKPQVDPKTGKRLIKKKPRRGASEGATDYELDVEGNPRLDSQGNAIVKYEVDKKTGKQKVDPKTGKPVKKRLKKEESAADTEYEVDEKTGKLKIDSTGRPIVKYEIDPKTGKAKVDARTGKQLVSRKKTTVAKRGGEYESSTYEIDFERGKVLRDPATGQFIMDPKTGRKLKVRRKGGPQGGNYSSHSSDYDINGKTGEKALKPGRANLGRRKKDENSNYNDDANTRLRRSGGFQGKEYEVDPKTGKKTAKKNDLLTPEGIEEMEAKVNDGLRNAAISKNASIKKKTVKEMKNPILDAMRDTLKIGQAKLTKDYFISMKGPQMLSLMDKMMMDKGVDDLRCETLPIKERRTKSFAQFMFYTMLMQYGLQTLAVKTLIQLSNGLKKAEKTLPFAHLLTQMLGMGVPPLRLDEIGIVTRAHLFFKTLQETWLNDIKSHRTYLKVSDDMVSNLETGGWLNIFDLMEELKVALKNEKEICERLLTSLKPDCLLKKSDDQKKLSMEYCVLKVTTRIAKIGKDPTAIFEQIDFDKSGTLSPQEILQGCRSVLGVFFSTEEANLFTMYLDADGSGDVDIDEFVSKITLNNLHREAHKFLISELTFIEKMLTEWYFVQRKERELCAATVKQFDENEDGIFQINEFKAMLRKFEPDIEDKKVFSLFKECCSISQNGNLSDAINPEVLYMCFMQYKIRGFGKAFFSSYLTERTGKNKKEKQKKK